MYFHILAEFPIMSEISVCLVHWNVHKLPVRALAAIETPMV